MRIDFREERKWKLALAYNLSTSVLEWHFAKTTEERLRAGICVKWKASQFKNDEAEGDPDTMEIDQLSNPLADQTTQDVQIDPSDPRADLLGVNYGSDDDDEDDKDKDDVIDPLEPAALMEEVLNSADEIQPKHEEMDEQSAMTLLRETRDDTDFVQASVADAAQIAEDVKGLKLTSINPILGDSKSSSQSTNGDVEPPIAPSKPSAAELVPLRERIVYSSDDQLFVDIGAVTSPDLATGDVKVESGSRDYMDLMSLFPDLQPLGMLDVAQPVPLEGKKKLEKKSDKDDPNKRIEDTTYTKLYPTGRFMYTKPTLIGPLQASKRFRDGKWMPIEQVAIVPDPECSVKITDENTSGRSTG